MNALGLVVTLGLIATIVLACLAFVLLRRAPPSLTRNLSFALMVILAAASVLTLTMSVENSSGFRIIASSLSNLLTYWSAAVIFHLILSFTKFKGISLKATGQLVIYFPYLALTVSLAAVAIARPSDIGLVTSVEPPYTHFGFLDPIFMAVGGAYIVSSMIAILWMLRSGAEKIRPELIAMSGFIALEVGGVGTLSVIMPQFSYGGIYLVNGSFLGILLCSVVLKRSVLIIPQHEEFVSMIHSGPLRPGKIYLVLRDEIKAREFFVQAIRSGRQGLWVTRKRPDEARKIHGLVKTPFIWLTGISTDGENCIDPNELGRLTTAITWFIKDATDSIILLEGIEYITSKTGFSTVLKLIQILNDRVMSSGGILLISLNPSAFKPEEMALLESESEVLSDGRDDKIEPRQGTESGSVWVGGGQRALANSSVPETGR